MTGAVGERFSVASPDKGELVDGKRASAPVGGAHPGVGGRDGRHPEPAALSCDPRYAIDEQGHRRYERGCV